jgi:heme/copper-type cytochrome/quinol oxidase subunit 1
LLVLAAGGVLCLVSVAVLVQVRRPAASFGWFAYAPLSDTAFPSGLVFLDPTHWWALAVGIVGLLAVGWAAGFLAGRRAR